MNYASHPQRLEVIIVDGFGWDLDGDCVCFYPKWDTVSAS